MSPDWQSAEAEVPSGRERLASCLEPLGESLTAERGDGGFTATIVLEKGVS
jgi:hypothetical protein